MLLLALLCCESPSKGDESSHWDIMELPSPPPPSLHQYSGMGEVVGRRRRRCTKVKYGWHNKHRDRESVEIIKPISASYPGPTPSHEQQAGSDILHPTICSQPVATLIVLALGLRLRYFTFSKSVPFCSLLLHKRNQKQWRCWSKDRRTNRPVQSGTAAAAPPS